MTSRQDPSRIFIDAGLSVAHRMMNLLSLVGNECKNKTKEVNENVIKVLSDSARQLRKFLDECTEVSGENVQYCKDKAMNLYKRYDEMENKILGTIEKNCKMTGWSIKRVHSLLPRDEETNPKKSNVPYVYYIDERRNLLVGAGEPKSRRVSREIVQAIIRDVSHYDQHLAYAAPEAKVKRGDRIGKYTVVAVHQPEGKYGIEGGSYVLLGIPYREKVGIFRRVAGAVLAIPKSVLSRLRGTVETVASYVESLYNMIKKTLEPLGQVWAYVRYLFETFLGWKLILFMLLVASGGYAAIAGSAFLSSLYQLVPWISWVCTFFSNIYLFLALAAITSYLSYRAFKDFAAVRFIINLLTIYPSVSRLCGLFNFLGKAFAYVVPAPVQGVLKSVQDALTKAIATTTVAESAISVQMASTSPITAIPAPPPLSMPVSVMEDAFSNVSQLADVTPSQPPRIDSALTDLFAKISSSIDVNYFLAIGANAYEASKEFAGGMITGFLRMLGVVLGAVGQGTGAALTFVMNLVLSPAYVYYQDIKWGIGVGGEAFVSAASSLAEGAKGVVSAEEIGEAGFISAVSAGVEGLSKLSATTIHGLKTTLGWGTDAVQVLVSGGKNIASLVPIMGQMAGGYVATGAQKLSSVDFEALKSVLLSQGLSIVSITGVIVLLKQNRTLKGRMEEYKETLNKLLASVNALEGKPGIEAVQRDIRDLKGQIKSWIRTEIRSGRDIEASGLKVAREMLTKLQKHTENVTKVVADFLHLVRNVQVFVFELEGVLIPFDAEERWGIKLPSEQWEKRKREGFDYLFDDLLLLQELLSQLHAKGKIVVILTRMSTEVSWSIFQSVGEKYRDTVSWWIDKSVLEERKISTSAESIGLVRLLLKEKGGYEEGEDLSVFFYTGGWSNVQGIDRSLLGKRGRVVYCRNTLRRSYLMKQAQGTLELCPEDETKRKKCCYVKLNE